MAAKGYCMCGAVTVTVSEPAKESTLCHCDNCKRQSGATGTIVTIVDKDKVKIDGEVKTYVDKKTDSGTPMDRCSCAVCGSPIYSYTKLMPEKIVVKMGIFDEIPKVTGEWFCINKQGWEPSVEGAALSEKTPQ